MQFCLFPLRNLAFDFTLLHLSFRFIFFLLFLTQAQQAHKYFNQHTAGTHPVHVTRFLAPSATWQGWGLYQVLLRPSLAFLSPLRCALMLQGSTLWRITKAFPVHDHQKLTLLPASSHRAQCIFGAGVWAFGKVTEWCSHLLRCHMPIPF